MTADQGRTIQPPMDRDRGSLALLRVILEAGAQFSSLTAALATIYRYTHPTRMEEDLQRFHEEVAQRLNDHDQILQELKSFLEPRAVLGDAAIDLVIELLRADTRGRGSMIMFSDIRAAFPQREKRYLEDAAGELSVYGYLEITPTIGHAVAGMSLQLSAYMAFDKAALGHDTQADAVEIASLLLDRDELANFRRLKEHLGWHIRRLNPALAALLVALPTCVRSKEICELVTSQIVVGPNERFILKRISQTRRLEQ